MNRPKLNIELAPRDKWMEGIALIGLLLLLGLPLYYYNSLPATLPAHFGLDGQADASSSRGSIWTLPVLGIFLYVMLTFLNKYPHKFNYFQEITPENAERQYQFATRVIRFLKMIIMWILAYIVYATIQTALQHQPGLGSYFGALLSVFIVGIVIYTFVKSPK